MRQSLAGAGKTCPFLDIFLFILLLHNGFTGFFCSCMLLFAIRNIFNLTAYRDGMMTDRKLLKSFRRYLKVSNRRYTKEREELVKSLRHIEGFFDIGELVRRITVKRKVKARSTIYRNIFLLIDAGYIREVRLNNGNTVYESNLSGEDHDYMVCVSCGKMIPFSCPDFAKAFDKDCQTSGFEPINCAAVIKGFCAECVKNSEK